MINTFKVGQRVRILPCLNYPPTKAPGGVRYGIITGMTQTAGMCIQNKQQPYPAPLAYNAKGEWAYSVASFKNPQAGALWFTAEGLEPMKRDRKTF